MAQIEDEQVATLLNTEKDGPNAAAANSRGDAFQGRVVAPSSRKSAVLWLCAFPALFLAFSALSAVFHHATTKSARVYPTDTNYPIGGGWAEDGEAYGQEPEYHSVGPVQSNGTHQFEQLTIIVSLDGVRPEYLTRSLTPHLSSLAHSGISAKFMEPIFPSLTFPNHWSMMTGLYAESHGIVANDFYDPEQGKRFHYTTPQQSWPVEWWGGEPAWETIHKAGYKTAICMWPGPPEMASGARPSYWRAFEVQPWTKKLATLTSWIDLPISKRPNLIAMYLPEIDVAGHEGGPDSSNVEEYLKYADDFLASLSKELQNRNLDDLVNMVVVSDHGMAETSNDRIIYLDDILGEEGYSEIEHHDGWPSAGLRFKAGTDTQKMWASLKHAEAESKGSFAVYNHSSMPAEYHYSDSPRIAAIYVVPALGWAISSRKEHLEQMDGDYTPKGVHGYDPTEPEMHSIFLASGPYFNTLASPIVLEGFQNVELYGLLMRLLDVPQSLQAQTNGTGKVWDSLFSKARLS